MDISNNEIFRLEAGSFSGVTEHLQGLNLSKNKLKPDKEPDSKPLPSSVMETTILDSDGSAIRKFRVLLRVPSSWLN